MGWQICVRKRERERVVTYVSR